MCSFYRIKITGWTASFRYPIFVYGYQPTLPLPPYSAVYGLISAACGRLVTPADNIEIKYVFKSDSKGVDLETIYEWKVGGITKSNVIKREFFLNPELYLYTKEKEIADCFRKPYYPLLLGRSTELAFVEEIKKVNLIKKENFMVGGIILPFPPMWPLNGIIQALPTHFSDTFPRKAIGTRPWFLVKDFQKYRGKGWVDEEKGWGVIIEEEKSE
ncbi:type I-B CRISPR-associated protein Cas5 [bacterium]|nr:type I-B CRISPR-associated protein Cas5 [bacterium]